jgi:hypothetical protein
VITVIILLLLWFRILRPIFSLKVLDKADILVWYVLVIPALWRLKQEDHEF